MKIPISTAGNCALVTENSVGNSPHPLILTQENYITRIFAVFGGSWPAQFPIRQLTIHGPLTRKTIRCRNEGFTLRA